MPRFTIITSQAIPAKSGVALMARVVGYNRTPITQATLSAVAYTLTDLTLSQVLYANQPLTIAAVVFDSLQQGDAAWGKDGPATPGKDLLFGYNFKAVLPAAQIVNGGDRYRADVLFTPASGEPFAVLFEWRSLEVYF